MSVEDEFDDNTIAHLIDRDLPGLSVLSASPAVFFISDFLTEEESDDLIEQSRTSLVRSSVVSDDGYCEFIDKRTSSSWGLDKCNWLQDKVSALIKQPVANLEPIQVTRYQEGELYADHLDAGDAYTKSGRRFGVHGGQRIATVLVYLNDVSEGGETCFGCIPLKVKPQKGAAVVFFPGSIDGKPDTRLWHRADPPVGCEKWVSQIWCRQRTFKQTASWVGLMVFHMNDDGKRSVMVELDSNYQLCIPRAAVGNDTPFTAAISLCEKYGFDPVPLSEQPVDFWADPDDVGSTYTSIFAFKLVEYPSCVSDDVSSIRWDPRGEETLAWVGSNNIYDINEVWQDVAHAHLHAPPSQETGPDHKHSSSEALYCKG